jgi:hypothetical protein
MSENANKTAAQTAAVSILDSLAVVRFSGADALSFLQGQLTQDMLGEKGRLLAAGYCSPRGRLIATPRLVVLDDGSVLTAFPKAGLDAILKRLRMYVMRSKVTITQCDDMAVLGFVGAAPESFAGAAVYRQGSAAPAALIAAALPAGRAMAFVDRGAIPEGCTDESFYWLASIAAGDPWVFESTREQFVPQAINLECVGGVSFTKGCYTGQEIVSRVEHIGKTARRAALFAANAELDAEPGADVLEDGAPAGLVIQSATRSGRTLMLVQVDLDHLQSRNLSFASEALHPLHLPYPYERG